VIIMSLRGVFAATKQSPLNRRSLIEEPVRLIGDCFAIARNDMWARVKALWEFNPLPSLRAVS